MACCIPNSSIPYVQVGRTIALYTVSFLSSDSCESAFISQLMFYFDKIRPENGDQSCPINVMCEILLQKNEEVLKTNDFYFLLSVPSFHPCFCVE